MIQHRPIHSHNSICCSKRSLAGSANGWVYSAFSAQRSCDATVYTTNECKICQCIGFLVTFYSKINIKRANCWFFFVWIQNRLMAVGESMWIFTVIVCFHTRCICLDEMAGSNLCVELEVASPLIDCYLVFFGLQII